VKLILKINPAVSYIPQNGLAGIYSYSLQTWSKIISSNTGWKPVIHEPPAFSPALMNAERNSVGRGSLSAKYKVLYLDSSIVI